MCAIGWHLQDSCHCHPFFTSVLEWAPQRYFYQSLQVCGCLVPPLLVAPRLTFCRLHLCVCSGPDTHTNTGDTSTPVYTHSCKIQGHKHKQGTQVFQYLKMPVSSNVGDEVSRLHVLPFWDPCPFPPPALQYYHQPVLSHFQL